MRQTDMNHYLPMVLIILFLTVLSCNTVLAVQSNPEDRLLKEVRRVIQQISVVKNRSDDGTFTRRISTYKEKLSEMENFLKRSQPIAYDRLINEGFDQLSEVKEAYVDLIEEVGKSRNSELAGLGEDYEDQKKLIDSENLVPRTKWFDEYNHHLKRYANLERHHQLTVELFGFLAALKLSDSTKYRGEIYLSELHNEFPEVNRAILDNSDQPTPRSRSYRDMLDLVSSFLDETDPSDELKNRFLRTLRSQGLILKEIRRWRVNSSFLGSIIEHINRVMDVHFDRELSLDRH